MKKPMNVKNPERATETVFYVPNDAEGQAFIKAMRKYLNRSHWKMRPYSRNPNRKQYRDRYTRYRLRSSVPVPLATYYGVFIWNDGHRENAHREYMARWNQLVELENQINNLKDHIDSLKGEKSNLEMELLSQTFNAMKESQRIHTPQRKIKVTDWSELRKF